MHMCMYKSLKKHHINTAGTVQGKEGLCYIQSLQVLQEKHYMLNSDIRLVIQHFQHYDYAFLKCLKWFSVWVMDPKG